MLHYELIIPDSDIAKNIDILIFSMPVLDSRMYMIPCNLSDDNSNKHELLIIDPCLWDEAEEDAIRQICKKADHATVLVTHSHYDHIAGANKLREFVPLTLYATDLCDKKMQDAHKNLAAYSMALVMDKTEERQRYCEQYFDFNYSCKADEIYDESLWISLSGRSYAASPGTDAFATHAQATVSDTASSLYEDQDSLYVRTIYTPEHSDCSQCIELHYAPAESCKDKTIETSLLAVFTGDSLVNGHDVITRFPSGSKKVFRETAEPYLMSLPDDLVIFPGHGDPALFGEIKDYSII